MKFDEFLTQAGGVYTSSRDYEDFSGRDKYENFWSFFLDREFGWVRSVYANIPIENLYKNGHSIEHVVPKSILRDRLRDAGQSREVIKGARTNPLNFMAAHSHLNSLRSNNEFDSEGDAIVRSKRVPLNPNAAIQTGLDDEGEWVIPSRTQGDIARCVLYMMLVYGLNGLYEEDIDNMRRWALIDPPSDWEIAFNNWVFRRLQIRNPLITENIDTLKSILESQDLFATTLLENPPLPATPKDKLPQGLENGYAVLVGKVERITRDADDTPHMLFRITSEAGSWRGSINVRSRFNVSVDPQPGIPNDNLLVYINENWSHPITEMIERKNYQPGLHFVERAGNSVALDYIRGNLFPPEQMIIMPSDEEGLNNDLFERLEAILLEARDRNATVYAFGEPFANGRGIHNIHMNQGSISQEETRRRGEGETRRGGDASPRPRVPASPRHPVEDFKKTDGVWQDGGLIVRFAERWVAVFTAFQSQCWHTDDTTGQANEEGHCSRFSGGESAIPGVVSGGLVRIVSALVNPSGEDTGNEQVTIINLGEDTVDLAGWQIVDRLKRVEGLTGVLSPGASMVVTLSGDGALLGNSGGTITLLDAQGLRVHGVSYTREQARNQGRRIVFVD